MHFHIIYNIFWTNLLIQCSVPVFVCFIRALQKRVKNKSARKIPEKYPCQNTPEARRGPRGGHPLARRLNGATRGVAAPPGHLGQWATPQAPLWHIFSPRPENLQRAPRHAISSIVPSSRRFRSRDRMKNLSWHPVGGRINLRRPLHHHDRLRDVP